MLAYDYPILGLFWTMLILFLWVAWIMLVFQVIVDVIRSDMGASRRRCGRSSSSSSRGSGC